MTMTQDELLHEREKKDEIAREFEEWKRGPIIKMIISLLPPLESDMQRDCFNLLMMSAFDHGCRVGGGLASRDFIVKIIEARNKLKD